MADENKWHYLFVAIDRATRWGVAAVYPVKTAANAKRFLVALTNDVSLSIQTILTDNGKGFTDRFFSAGEHTPTGHTFDPLGTPVGLEHHLTPT